MLHQYKFPEVEGLMRKEMRILRYYVKELEHVKEGQAIAEVDAGIATFDVPADREGMIKTLPIPVGGPLHVGDVIYIMVTYGEDDKVKTKWEYKTISVAETALFTEEGVKPENLKAYLNSMGKVGWELVTGIDTRIMADKDGGMVLVLKRQTWK
jgi:pyruvate/2-oxoglutarate dehydrogenase complex dihydrolipoamide acyltransferase (E2) component